MSDISERIRVISKKEEIRKTLIALPKKLTGIKLDQSKVHEVFQAAFTYKLFDLIHKSYRNKSLGRTDRFFQRWKPLAKSTLARHKALGLRLPSILHETGRLEASLTPGTYAAGSDRYNPPDDQILAYKRGTVTIGTEVPYAVYQHPTRRLWPQGNELDTLVTEAVQYGINNVIRYIVRTGKVGK